MGRWRVCIVSAVVGVALVMGLVVCMDEAQAGSVRLDDPPTLTPYAFPTPVPPVWSTPIFALPTFEPFTFGLTDTQVYSGFWTYEKWWGTMGLIQKGYTMLNNFHIINLVVVFVVAAFALALIVKLIVNRVFKGHK